MLNRLLKASLTGLLSMISRIGWTKTFRFGLGGVMVVIGSVMQDKLGWAEAGVMLFLLVQQFCQRDATAKVDEAVEQIQASVDARDIHFIETLAKIEQQVQQDSPAAITDALESFQATAASTTELVEQTMTALDHAISAIRENPASSPSNN